VLDAVFHVIGGRLLQLKLFAQANLASSSLSCTLIIAIWLSDACHQALGTLLCLLRSELPACAGDAVHLSGGQPVQLMLLAHAKGV
jgi:hypothetical protein